MTIKELINIRTEVGLKKHGVKKIVIKYNDKSKKEFTLEKWVIFRKNIVENLYNKDLCKINFELV